MHVSIFTLMYISITDGVNCSSSIFVASFCLHLIAWHNAVVNCWKCNCSKFVEMCLVNKFIVIITNSTPKVRHRYGENSPTLSSMSMWARAASRWRIESTSPFLAAIINGVVPSCRKQENYVYTLNMNIPLYQSLYIEETWDPNINKHAIPLFVDQH